MRQSIAALFFILSSGFYIRYCSHETQFNVTEVPKRKSSPYLVQESKCFLNQHDFDLLVKTVWGEARSEGYAGMRAVAEVVVNRALHPKAWPNEVKDVVKENYQFSCWNANDPNFKKLSSVSSADPRYQVAQKAVLDAIKQPLLAEGATHYHTVDIRPDWVGSMRLVKQIGRHKFYR